MTVDTITVFSAGTFTTEKAPDWLIAADESATENNRSWDDALTSAIGSKPSITKVEPDAVSSVEVIEWMTPGGGRYVEFWDTFRAVSDAWIPDPADWLAFYSAHVLPFLNTHAHIANASHLERIGNCLISYGRHGDGRHIDIYTGRSQIDINQRRALAKSLGQ